MALTIESKKKQVDVFTVGGREFLTKGQAQAHLEALNQTLEFTYYLVDSGFDGTEGRGYFSHRIVAVQPNAHGNHTINALHQWLFTTFDGEAVMEWYGRPVAQWNIHEGKTFDDEQELLEWKAKVRSTYAVRHHRFEGTTFIDGFGKEIPKPAGYED